MPPELFDTNPNRFTPTCPISSLKVEVKKKHISFGRNFSCFSAHLIERDLKCLIDALFVDVNPAKEAPLRGSSASEWRCRPPCIRAADPQKQVDFRIYLVSKGRSVMQATKGQQKRTSVPDFRRTHGSLQLGGVQWTSPRRCTHTFDSFHLGSTRTCKKQED